jgi:hypothetical protein
MRKALLAFACFASTMWGQEGSGPFRAVMEQDPGLPTHTIHCPRDLAALKAQSSRLLGGSSACVNKR